MPGLLSVRGWACKSAACDGRWRGVSHLRSSRRECLRWGEARCMMLSQRGNCLYFSYCFRQTGMFCLCCPRQWGNRGLVCKRISENRLHPYRKDKTKSRNTLRIKSISAEIILKNNCFRLHKRLHRIQIAYMLYALGSPQLTFVYFI